MKHLIFFLTLWLSAPFFGLSQVDDPGGQFFANLEEEQIEAIKALVLYPDEVRASILNAAQHPATLSKMGILQARTKAEFERIMNYVDEDDREEVWNLTRYPGLLSSLLNRGDMSMNEVLASYPEELKKPAKMAIRKYKYEMREIVDLESTVHESFQDMVATLPEKGKEAFTELLALPEVLSILYENLELTILIGDKYKTDPQWVLQMADSLNLEMAKENAQEYEDWKKRIEEDPEALNELKELTQEYTGVDDVDDVYSRDQRYDDPDDNRVEVIYRYYAYPYWFGYPYWYSYPRWRPYPHYLDWGFYWSSSSAIVFVGMPSPYFMNWYFYHPYHFNRYPRLCNHFFDHHYAVRHRNSRSSINSSIRNWKYQNREVVRDSWLRDKNVRTMYLNQYASMNRDRAEYNVKNRTDISQKEYLTRNKARYKDLNRAAVTREKMDRQTRVQDDVRKPGINPDRKPSVDKPRKPTVKPIDKQPARVPTRTQPVKPAPKPKQAKKIREASQYHKNNWEVPKRKPAPTRTTPRVVKPQPRPRSIPNKPAPKPRVPVKKRN